MKQQIRELLVTTKVAQGWQGDFEQKVDELINIVSRVDSLDQVNDSAELLDVYNKTNKKPGRQKKKKVNLSEARPFAFFVFRN